MHLWSFFFFPALFKWKSKSFLIYSRAALELSSCESLLTWSSKDLPALRPGCGLPSCLQVKLKEKIPFLHKKREKSPCCVRESDLPGAAENANLQNSRLKSACLARLCFQAPSTFYGKCFMEINTPLKAVAGIQLVILH